LLKVEWSKLVMLCSLLSSVGGCSVPESRTASGMIASDEPRIWVVKTTVTSRQSIAEVYRCADGAEVNQPPKPVCIKAGMVEQPQ
jgi:hypothetical protein